MKYTQKSRLQRGFSLVEMLVVIAVIGVIAAIAIPNIGSINAAAMKAEQQRNAQTLASLFSAGQAAGVTWAGTSVAALITEIQTGKAPTTGVFSGQMFKLPQTFSTTDLTGITAHLAVDATQTPLVLNYVP